MCVSMATAKLVKYTAIPCQVGLCNWLLLGEELGFTVLKSPKGPSIVANIFVLF